MIIIIIIVDFSAKILMNLLSGRKEMNGNRTLKNICKR